MQHRENIRASVRIHNEERDRKPVVGMRAIKCATERTNRVDLKHVAFPFTGKFESLTFRIGKTKILLRAIPNSDP